MQQTGPVDPFKGFLRGDPSKGPEEYAPPAAAFADPRRIMGEPLALWMPGSPRLFLGLVGGTPAGPPGQGRHILGGMAIGIEDDRHVCTFAGSRAGKGRSVIVPNMLYWPGSVLATDPKGELAAITARQRERLGQAVHVLDPFGVTDGTHAAPFATGFNPIAAMRDATLIEDAALIADALVVMEGSDPHWDESGKAFIEGVTLHVRTAEDLDGRRDLFTVQDLVNKGAADAKAPGGSSMDALYARMLRNGAAGGVIQAVAANMASKPEKERESILSTARRHLKFLDLFRQTDGAKRTIQQDGFRLQSLKLAPTTVYLCLPARHIGTCGRWLRLFVNLALQGMEQSSAAGLPGRAPVLFVLDEFASLGRMQQIENAAGQIAGFGVKLWPVLQDIGQLRDLYKFRWETFLGNAGLLQFFGNTDLGTLEWLSKRLGSTTIRVPSERPKTSDQGGRGLPGESMANHTVKLLEVDEAARLFGRDDAQRRQLVLWGGQPPLVLQRANYDTHGLFRDRLGNPLFDPAPATVGAR